MVNILGANSVSGGYEIDNSLRFNDGDTASLNDTQSAGNRDTWTFSAWVKRGSLGTNQIIVISGTADTDYMSFSFVSNDKLNWHQYNGSGYDVNELTNAVYRDSSAWYHIVLRVNTADSTAGDRVIVYVNGVRQSVDSSTQFDQNEDTDFNNNNNTLDIGNDAQFNIGYNAFDGYMADINFIDGTAKAPTDFGETDDNGVWIPKEYEGNYGTNGFYLQFKETGTSANASGIGADTSGTGNHLGVTNLAATDVTTDTPTNNFCTLNPLGGINSSGKWTFSEGNTQIQQNNNNNWRATGSTMAVANGKWYWEIEFDAGTMSHIFVGVHDSDVSLEGTNRWVTGSTLFYNHEGGEIRQDGTNTTADYGVLTAGDILGVALNMDDKQISFYDNGNAIVSNFALSSSITGFAMPTFIAYSSNVVYKVNFGNPAFAISSGNADANGHGNFEYAPPSGYFALCSKNLGQFG